MSATLVAKEVAAARGGRNLFDDLDLVVGPAERVGLVGPNGAGKSSLLRILAGLDAPAAGSVRLAPSNASVGYLAQEPQRRPGEVVLDFLARRTGVAEATRRMDAATRALTDDEPGAADTYADALERWLALGGADFAERADASAADLGLAIDLTAPMTGLSGGQAARAGLAALLLSRFDVFLLDEPTNDLDLDGLERLESFVAGRPAGTVVVSHDREFLSRTVTSILEIDAHQHQIAFYRGGYESYLEERARARGHAREDYEQYAARRDALAARARMQRAWMDKGVRNARRKASDNDKIRRNLRGETSEKQAAKARQTERMIERLEVVAEPRKEWELRMTIGAAPRSGAVVATLRDAVVQRGPFTLGPVNLHVDWADRIVLTGPNGAGKTTLLAAMLGRVPLAAGAATLGPGVVVGEVDQARGLFAGADSPLDILGRFRPEMSTADARTLLAKFALGADHVGRAAATLSPGERTRAALALLQARGVNLLILDEPTNHLDLPAIEQLESALHGYPGTLVLVTHDRQMLAAVDVTRHLHVEAGKLTELDR
ncbi:ABC-F family ATP-binding cassette domain-containing protein [Frankia sp. CiP1_Cm_nod1]|uniref:ABC-F family ATP-binding cassette domain-containing protein n=2 Tax=unclassified Frankia TaxID=2632575 RepID=UPI002023EFAE